MGSVVAVFMVYGINTGYDSTTKQGLIFLLFACIGAVGAFYSWAYLPDIQRRTADGKLVNRSLEELGEGLRRAEVEGQVFTFKENWRRLRRRI
jgi:MFS transporter, PHS family, inorganic phosphate transporter